MRYCAVIDTNVLVSAMLKWNSVPGTVMALVFDGPITPILSKEILTEYREVLSRPKFRFTEEIVRDVLESMTEAGMILDAEQMDIELPDPKDRVFYEVVMEGRKREDAYLITGNLRHFPSEPFIVTPRQMLDIVVGDREKDIP